LKAIVQAQRTAAAIVAVLEGKPGGSAKTTDVMGELGVKHYGAMTLALGVAVRKGYVTTEPLRGTVTLTELGRRTLAEGRAIIEADART
jgi:DNA-binding PadR family transcriptional regulator